MQDEWILLHLRSFISVKYCCLWCKIFSDHESSFAFVIMSLQESCAHVIKIVNFGLNDVVTYPIVRIVGLVQKKDSSCKKEEEHVTLILKESNSERKIPLINNKFKTLIELQEGKNKFELTFGCQSLEMILDYGPTTSDYSVMPLYVICEGHDGYFQGRDIMNSDLASDKRKYLAFLSCTKYNGDQFSEESQSHDDLLKITEAYVALGGGGLALFGTACLYTWPENFSEIISRFEDGKLVDKSKFLDDSCYRGTLGSCFSTTLGSVLHELYHTFNLGHTETGVMGRGFDNINKFFITVDASGRQGESPRSFQDQIEFKEEFEADKLSERLIKEHKKKDFNIIRKFEDNDCTYLTKSCAVILAYHRWFNTYSSNMPYTLTYDSSNNFIRSTGGIRVIEIRRDPDEMILYDWIFDGKVLKFSFRIPDEVFTEKVSSTLFVQDNWGNILKQSFLV